MLLFVLLLIFSLIHSLIRPFCLSPSGGDGRAHAAHDPEFVADADIGKGHDREREDEHDEQHVEFIQHGVHRVLPVLHAPVSMVSIAHLSVNL